MTQDKNKIEVVFIEAVHKTEVDYRLEDLRGKTVFDVSTRPPRPVLVTETGLWVAYRGDKDCAPTYDKLMIWRANESDKTGLLIGQCGGIPRKNAEETRVAQDLDELESRVRDYSQ